MATASQRTLRCSKRSDERQAHVTVAEPNAVAGWYPDPSNAAQLRYWSGTTWTDHTSAVTTTAFVPPQRRAVTPESTARAARFGTLSNVFDVLANAYLIAGTTGVLVIAYALSHWGRDENGDAGSAILGVVVLAYLILYAIALASMIFGMVWTYRINEDARLVNITPRLSSVLACLSWIIPYANLVMPYFAVAGAVPETDDRKPFVHWWLWRIVAPIVAVLITAVITAVAMTLGTGALTISAGVALATATVVAIFEYRAGKRVVRVIRERHTSLAALQNTESAR
jgi:hypothetical protein